MLDLLEKSRPWVFVLAVTNGISGLFGIGFAFWELGVPEVFTGEALLALASSAIVLWLAAILLQLSNSLGKIRLAASGQPRVIEGVLSHQLSYWRLSGALAALSLLIGLVGTVLGVVFPSGP